MEFIGTFSYCRFCHRNAADHIIELAQAVGDRINSFLEIVMEAILGIFSAFGLSASAGLNAYIPLLVVALMARFTSLHQTQSPL